MLVQEVAAKYPGQVTFVSENFGASKLAERFGVKGYPAIFVDDVLVAAPREFGYFGEVEGSGRYAPWKNADNQAKFKADLTRMIDLVLEDPRLERIAALRHPHLLEVPEPRLNVLEDAAVTARKIRIHLVP